MVRPYSHRVQIGVRVCKIRDFSLVKLVGKERKLKKSYSECSNEGNVLGIRCCRNGTGSLNVQCPTPTCNRRSTTILMKSNRIYMGNNNELSHYDIFQRSIHAKPGILNLRHFKVTIIRGKICNNYFGLRGWMLVLEDGVSNMKGGVYVP